MNQVIVVVATIHSPADHQLLHAVEASDALRLILGSGQGRQQHCRQNCDNGDHDEQFDQCETGANSAEQRGLTAGV